MPGLEHYAAVVLGEVNGVTRPSTTLEVRVEPSEEPQELPLIVERSNKLMAALVTFRIVSIVAHHVALDVVIVGVHGRHTAKCASASNPV
ncbi:MAG: hypothetical protein ACHQ4F_13795 [Candidatus Dormibacteria bacterium]